MKTSYKIIMSRFSMKKIPSYLNRIISEIKGWYFVKSLKQVKKIGSSYSSININGLVYLFNIEDVYIPKKMYITEKNFSEDEINFFINWTKKYYDIDINQCSGYFLDVGANIGTTCVYVSKHYPNLHLIAFEPDEDNFKCLKANCILNNLSRNISVVNKGLSNSVCKGKMRQFNDNRGKNYVIYEDSPKQDDLSLESIDITSLDIYLSEKSIDYTSIDFIWMDTEGFEPYVIDGAMALLKEKKVPIWMEFCGKTLRKHEGSYDILIANLKKVYSRVRFIDSDHCEREIEISRLDELLNRDDNFNLFLY